MRDWTFYDYADLERDAKDAEICKQLDAAIDKHIERAKSAPNAMALRARGDELCARVHIIGFHSATILIAIRQK